MAEPMMTRHAFPLLRLALGGLIPLVLAFGLLVAQANHAQAQAFDPQDPTAGCSST